MDRRDEENKENKEIAPDSLLRKVIFWSFGLSGLAALIYEVVWFRALSLVMGSTTYALSTMLATFMAGLAVGAFLGGLISDRVKNPALIYAYLEGGIAILSLAVLGAINLLPPLYAKLYYIFQFSFEAFSVSQFLLCFLVMLLPTVIMGGTFPIVCRICFTGGGIGRETGGIYAVNTLGAIAGSLLAGFVLIPNIGLRATNMVGASLNLAISISLLIMLGYKTGKGRALFLLRESTIPAVFFLMLFASSTVSYDQTYPFNFYVGSRYASYEDFTAVFDFSEILYERDNANGNIKVIKDVGGNNFLVNNGKIESNNTSDLLNLATLAYLPLAANPGARSFLNIGLGTGGTVYYAAASQALKEIYSVEINPAVTEASRLFFYPGIFKDKRIKFITADARNYLSVVEKKYDVISSEPSYPVDQGFSHLYSREFFEIVKGRLNEGGVFCQWVPRYIFRGEDFRMMAKTFQTVFPEVALWMARSSGDFLLLGRERDGLNVNNVKRDTRMAIEGAGLMPEGFELISDRGGVENRLRNYNGAVNTDDQPLVEFIGTRRMFERVKN